jgi:hypothetical protein
MRPPREVTCYAHAVLKQAPQLTIPPEPIALPDPHAVAALLRDFAAPLLYVDKSGPMNIDTLKTTIMLAMICWNVPVYEATQSPMFQRGERTLQQIKAQVPARVNKALDQLIESRKTTFADRPFLVIAEVLGTHPNDASIVAEARWATSKFPQADAS